MPLAIQNGKRCSTENDQNSVQIDAYLHSPLNRGSRAAPLGGHNRSRDNIRLKVQFWEPFNVIEIINCQFS